VSCIRELCLPKITAGQSRIRVGFNSVYSKVPGELELQSGKNPGAIDVVKGRDDLN
jgi:hypothetical protein